MNTDKLKPLSFVFALGGVWDTIAGFLYIFAIGSERNIDHPPMDPFYAIFLGSFFLCFAYLQFMSALNIRRYALNVGCLIIGRVFYIVLLYSHMVFVPGFPDTFWFTGIIDGMLTLGYLMLAAKGGLKAGELFLPSLQKN